MEITNGYFHVRLRFNYSRSDFWYLWRYLSRSVSIALHS